MALYKRGSVWWMSFTHHGKQLRRSTETEDKKLAIRIFDKCVSMVQRYAHHYPESLRSAIEVMDNIRKPFITNLSQSQKNRGHKPLLRLVSPLIMFGGSCGNRTRDQRIKSR